MILSLGLLLFAGCEKETTKGDRYARYYPAMSLVGGTAIYNAKGTAYVDPGIVATYMGEDVTETVVVAGTVNVNVEGVYTLTYVCKVADGTTVELKRNVVVGDAATGMADISGTYTTTVSRDGVSAASKGYPQPWTATLKLVEGAPNNYYEISDLISSWYQARFSVEQPDIVKLTNTPGIILIAADGVVYLADSFPDQYFKPAMAATSKNANNSIGTWNSTTGVINITTLWTGFTFDGVYTPVVTY